MWICEKHWSSCATRSFYKTRVVPVGTQLREVMVQYAKRRKGSRYSQSANAPFFLTRRSAPLTVALVESSFQRLRAHAGVCRDDSARYQPSCLLYTSPSPRD